MRIRRRVMVRWSCPWCNGIKLWRWWFRLPGKWLPRVEWRMELHWRGRAVLEVGTSATICPRCKAAMLTSHNRLSPHG